MFVLFTGGARSGKSRAAVSAAEALAAPVSYLATGRASDAEMAERIARHRADRPASWTVVEEPVALDRVVDAANPDHTLIVDCLALWTTNSLDRSDTEILDEARRLAAMLAGRPGAAFVVTNEVGDGVVPDNALARRFRDLLGLVNQEMAAHADRSFLCVAGRLLELQDPAAVMSGLDHV